MALYLVIARSDGTLFAANHPKSEVHEFGTDKDALEWFNSIKHYEVTMMRLPNAYGQPLVFIGYKPGEAGKNSPNYESPVRHDDTTVKDNSTTEPADDTGSGSSIVFGHIVVFVLGTIAALGVGKLIGLLFFE